LRGIGFSVELFLPAFAAETLPEVSVVIKETNRNQRQGQITSRFQMIAREYAKPARVKRQRIVNAILRTKISHRMFLSDRGISGSFGS
jgi:hypothetical protein